MPTELQSLTAGMIAGAVEGFVTYPTEYVKTRSQFSATAVVGSARSSEPAVRLSPIAIIRDTVRQKGFTGLYSGAGALVAGNGLKAGVRFMTYDRIKDVLKDENGKLSAGNSLIAGLGAGVCEAVIAVTPSETIKTKLIDDATRMTPRYTSSLNGTIEICREEGFRGIYRGLWPTILKQGSNSAVRFTSYNMLRDLALKFTSPGDSVSVGQKLSPQMTFVVGAGAGLVTVYTTMPFDTVKTRMQSIGAETRYRSTFHCLQRVIREEGVARLWGGTTPRLARLMLSGGIVFTVYESVIQML